MFKKWVKLAEGTNFENLQPLFGRPSRLLPGTPVEVRMTVGRGATARIFDLPGAELIFRPIIPPELSLVDVYEKQGQGFVAMKVRGDAELQILGIGAVVSIIIAFIKKHWIAAVIAGFVLGIIVTRITMWAYMTFDDIITGMDTWLLAAISIAVGAGIAGIFISLRRPHDRLERLMELHLAEKMLDRGRKL